MGESNEANTEPSPHNKGNTNRPASTKLFQSTVPRTGASYAEDYGPKTPNRTKISDLSAANLRNNPHPKEAFLSWRLQSRFPPLMEGSSLSEASSAEMEDNLRRKVKPVSTYQQDYVKESEVLGNLPLLSAPTDRVNTTTNSSSPSPSSLVQKKGKKGDATSEMCESYQVPEPSAHLRGNTTRYGCSSSYVKAACGVVPTLHPIVNSPNYQTWYANEFGVGTTTGGGKDHRRPPTPIYRLSLPPILQDRKLGSCKSARTARDRARRDRPRDKSSQNGGFSWLSEWAGPM